MSYGQMYEKALQIASEAHAGQVDKSGMPYILHPLTVASFCRTPEAKVVALLHDTIEDTEVTAAYLLSCGFPEKVVHEVQLLTKSKQHYNKWSYFKAISENAIAREVKMADLTHNMDLSRIKTPCEADYKRCEKYRREYEYLEGRIPA